MGGIASRGGSLESEELAWIMEKTGKSAAVIKEIHAEFRSGSPMDLLTIKTPKLNVVFSGVLWSL